MMKYHGSPIAWGVLIGSLTCGLHGALLLADEPAAATSAAAEKPLRLLFISPVIHEEFFLPVKKGMRDAAKQIPVVRPGWRGRTNYRYDRT